MLNTYYRNRLNIAQQRAYDDLCRGINRRSKEISVRYADDMLKVITAVNYDHPEFFYVNWMDTISYTVILGRAELRLNYIYNAHEIEELNTRMINIAKSIPGISDHGKALGIHDWFVKNIKYDHKGLKQIIRSPGMFSAAGPLKSQKAVCEGISKLACYLLRKKDVDAAIVTGTSQDGVPHAWNIINVDGQILYADITYDMGISILGFVQRKYFLLSREEMARDHTLDYF